MFLLSNNLNFFRHVFILSFLLHRSSGCLNVNVSITQKIENPGFHKTISWLVDIFTEPRAIPKDLNSHFALHLKVPPGMYVNPDEVADMVRRNELDAKIVGNVDVETPAHLSEGHEVFLYFLRTAANAVSVTLPIHLRYQRATIREQFGKIIFGKPSLLFYADPGTDEVLCGNFEKLSMVCRNSEENCAWYNVTYHALFDESILLVPVGNLEHYPFVVIGTLLLGCIGCLYILSLLMTAKTKQE